MADTNQFHTAGGLEGGFELMDESSRASWAGRPSAGAAKKVAAVAAVLALALVLSGCSMIVKPASKSTMEASDASMPASASSSSSSTQQETKWTEAASADAAARGAGFDAFGVIDKIEAGDLEFTNPRFSYADGVAQADYETGAAAVIVRKADGKHTAALTDEDTSAFAEKWTKSYEGLDVTLYGAARGAATVFTWTDGTQEFGVTFQGLGGEELSMDSDDAAAIVKGLHEANAVGNAAGAEPASSSSTASSDGSVDNNLTEADVQQIVFNQGLGAYRYASLIEGDDGVWYWQVCVADIYNADHFLLVDPYGNVTEQ